MCILTNFFGGSALDTVPCSPGMALHRWLVHAHGACLRHGAHVRMRQPRRRGRREGRREGLHGRSMQTARLLQCCSNYQSVPCSSFDTYNSSGVADIKACCKTAQPAHSSVQMAHFTT